ncbi:MAG: amidophosphoribosyltransferase [Acidobacteria bacterium]|nr:amidophosphoribosyltransferase [Acidobacteriota bacterium]
MCGIVGIFSREGRLDAAERAALALFGEQHRGQESCGLAWSDGEGIQLHKSMGLVKEVFTPAVLEPMKGHLAIGHVRYPTQGGATVDNAQPHLLETLAGPCYALSSNGDLVNYREIRKELERKGVFFRSRNDGEAILRLLAYLMEIECQSLISAIETCFTQLQGAYSTVLLTPHGLTAFRDPYGFRPMLLGEIEGGWAVTSESCALNILRARNIREIAPGEIVDFREDGVRTHRGNVAFFRNAQHPGTAHCVFEHIYFARPDSQQYGRRVYDVRREIGRRLAAGDAFTPDCVVPVPDSANFIAQGYAEAAGAPFAFGLIRNHYVGRTFIKPQQTFRDESVKQKFNPLAGFFEGKSVVLVDDSIVRGTTLRKLVRMIKGAGAREVHLRIGSPPVRYPCYYGIDTPTFEELIANQLSLEDLGRHLEADSLRYLSLGDLLAAAKNGGVYCDACFTGDYPVGVAPGGGSCA